MFKNLAKELREFILRGNVLDMAVGIIIGASFKSIVDSMVNDIIMPPIGMVLGKVDFTNLYISLSGNNDYPTLAAAQAAGETTINYGLFINTIINFIIVAFAVFILIKAINELQAKMDKKEAQQAVKTTKACPYCCSEVPLAATRCPHCTSELKVEEKAGKKK